MQVLKLRIDPDGTVTGIYSDALADLCEQGDARITRASSVEPDAQGGWTATMACDCTGCLIGAACLCRGECTIRPTLGPFRLRETALAAEVDYLERLLGL